MPPKWSKVTRSSASQKQRQEIHSIATASSPSKTYRTKKSRNKQASFKSPAVTGITPQVVTVTKQAKSNEESSCNGNSTGSKNALVTIRGSANLIWPICKSKYTLFFCHFMVEYNESYRFPEFWNFFFGQEKSYVLLYSTSYYYYY